MDFSYSSNCDFFVDCHDLGLIIRALEQAHAAEQDFSYRQRQEQLLFGFRFMYRVAFFDSSRSFALSSSSLVT